MTFPFRLFFPIIRYFYVLTVFSSTLGFAAETPKPMKDSALCKIALQSEGKSLIKKEGKIYQAKWKEICDSKKVSDEDRQFLSILNEVVGLGQSPLWMLDARKNSPACTKYGEYSWFRAFEIIRSSKDALPHYSKELSALTSDLENAFANKDADPICICGKKEALEMDIRALIAGVQDKVYYTNFKQVLETSLSSLRSNKWKIGSATDASCQPSKK